MEVVWALWAVVKFIAMSLWYGVVAVMWCVHHVGLIAVAVGAVWAVYNMLNPHSCGHHANWWAPALIAVCGGGVAFLQW